MTLTKTKIKTDTASKVKKKKKVDMSLGKAPKYCCILWDDNVTPMDFVVEILIIVFKLTQHQANRLMLMTHYKGSAKFGSYTKEEAEDKKKLALFLARTNSYPFQITIEPI